MATKALFISEDYVKENSVIDENVDVKLILPAIVQMQDMKLQTALGTHLFKDLNNKIVAGTLSADEVTLIEDYISPMLLKWVMFELTTVLLFKYRNKNVSKSNSENSFAIDTDEMNYLIGKWQNDAEWYEQRLIEYLCQEVAKFPKYTQAPNYSDIISKTNAFTCSFYLGNSEYEEERRKARKYLS
jgi:hypothetical protein